MINKNEDKKRTFGGVLTFNRPKSGLNEKQEAEYRHERNFHKAHLKAYLRGNELFAFGKNLIGEPNKYRVEVKWVTV